MPLIRSPKDGANVQYPGLVAEIASELSQPKDFGQPRIEETEFSTKAIRATAIWDKWDKVPDGNRPAVILEAYERVKGKAFRDRITLAIGLTFPEAYELGMLPYRLHPSVRSTDPVTELACNRAMRELGASDLFMPGKPVLRFASEEEAEKARSHLEKQLPGSHWLLDKDVALREL
jgi:hypothetical protein